MDRRSFIQKSTTGLILANIAGSLSYADYNKRPAGINTGPAGIGITDWNLGQPAYPQYISLAAKLGLQAIQVSVATSPENVPLRNRAIRQQYIELGKKHNIHYCSVAAGSILNRHALASEPQSTVYVIDALEAANALGSTNILTAFFGNGNLLKTDEDGNYINKSTGKYAEYEWIEKDVERVIAVTKQIVPRAEDLGVIIGLGRQDEPLRFPMNYTSG